MAKRDVRVVMPPFERSAGAVAALLGAARSREVEGL